MREGLGAHDFSRSGKRMSAGEQGKSPELPTWVSTRCFRAPRPWAAGMGFLPGEGALMTEHRGEDPAIGSFLSTCTPQTVMVRDSSQVRKKYFWHLIIC